MMPAKVLVYADADRSDIQLAVVIDDELSAAHELALLNLGGAAALGIQVEPPSQRPTLDPGLERARVPLPEVTRQRTDTAAVRLGMTASAPEESARPSRRGKRYAQLVSSNTPTSSTKPSPRLETASC